MQSRQSTTAGSAAPQGCVNTWQTTAILAPGRIRSKFVWTLLQQRKPAGATAEAAGSRKFCYTDAGCVAGQFGPIQVPSGALSVQREHIGKHVATTLDC